jgi:ribosomal protein S18 acetylase RimI-like enzyme
MTTLPQVTHTTDRARAIETIVGAFSADPVVRWVYPDDDAYFGAFPRFVEAFAGKAFDTGSAYTLPDTVAVALWLDPGLESDGEAMEALLGETVSPKLMEDVGGVMEQMGTLHPHEPHWYLPVIGVDPSHQGRGLGSALMAHAVAIADKDGLPAYLEATNLNNRRLYERHGFVAMGEIQSGSSPTIYAMRREAR